MHSALFLMLIAMAAGLGLMLASTALFQAKLLAGLPWQLLLSTGLYVPFALLGAPFNERLLAATRYARRGSNPGQARC